MQDNESFFDFFLLVHFDFVLQIRQLIMFDDGWVFMIGIAQYDSRWPNANIIAIDIIVNAKYFSSWPSDSKIGNMRLIIVDFPQGMITAFNEFF